MKKRKYIIGLFMALSLGFTSCNYLDVVPDEMDTEADAFKDRTAALRYVYSCYSYLPQARNGSGSLDFMTGDEVVTAFEHESFANFPKGNYSASSPVISYWNTFFQGLRQCYLFLDGVDKVPDLDAATKADYVAQVKFLIAYYHYLLIRCYGPTILIKETPKTDTDPKDYLARSPFDDCVDFVCNLFEEAAGSLPAKRSTVYEYGLATSVAAKAFKAKMLLYAASPLFNGNKEFYADLKNNDGTNLMPLEYDANKWVKAKEAMWDAIQLAEKNGYALYSNTSYEAETNPRPSDNTQRKLRYTIMEAGNPEIIFADCNDENEYGLQNKCMPFCSGAAWNGVAPTWAMLNRFYTKNGLPYDEDPEYKNQDKLQIVTVSEKDSLQAKPGEKTIRFNLDREPRFYAWVAFQGGYFEVMSATSNGAYAKDATYDGTRVVCNFVLGGNTSRLEPGGKNKRTNNYSPSGYLNKKGVEPVNAVSTSLKKATQYPWPLMRLADLYLGYAEACVETGDLDDAKTYLNKIRERAGIPDVEDSWQGVATLDQNKLRDIVRQERMIELYLENQNFWDMRRWLLAEKYFDTKAQGLNIDAESINDFAQIKTIDFERKFTSPTNYLLPFPSKDVNANINLVQNPGY